MSKEIDELLKKLGNISPEQLLAVSQAAAAKAGEERKNAFKGRIEKIIAFIKEQGLTTEEVVNYFKAPPVEIFKWNGNVVLQGAKGRAPFWTQQLKTEMGEKQALDFAVNQAGKDWVKRIYNPPAKK